MDSNVTQSQKGALMESEMFKMIVKEMLYLSKPDSALGYSATPGSMHCTEESTLTVGCLQLPEQLQLCCRARTTKS